MNFKDMTRGAYDFCGASGEDVDGDGMTPLFSAIAFEVADTGTFWADSIGHEGLRKENARNKKEE